MTAARHITKVADIARMTLRVGRRCAMLWQRPEQAHLLGLQIETNFLWHNQVHKEFQYVWITDGSQIMM